MSPQKPSPSLTKTNLLQLVAMPDCVGNGVVTPLPAVVVGRAVVVVVGPAGGVVTGGDP